MTIEDRNEMEQIGIAVGNGAVLAKVLAFSLADHTIEADAVMALSSLLDRLANEIGTIMHRQRKD